MRIGVMFDTEKPFENVVGQVASLHEAGIETAWASQIFAYDALTALAAIGREVPGIGLGTAVVPTYPRHPVMLAGQALTVQAASGGRLTLGIGLSHQMVIENVFGQSFEKPARHMKEYLSILIPCLEGEQVSFKGETLSASTFGPLQISAPAPPVLVAALGSVMLCIAGHMASGTVTWMTGPETLESHVIPTIRDAGRRSRPAGPADRRGTSGLRHRRCGHGPGEGGRGLLHLRPPAVLPGHARPGRRGRSRGRGHRRVRIRGQGEGPPSGRHRDHRLLRCAVRHRRRDDGIDRVPWPHWWGADPPQHPGRRRRQTSAQTSGEGGA